MGSISKARKRGVDDLIRENDLDDVIIFGVGKLSKDSIPRLEKNYHILFLVDNDKKKWGTIFRNYKVKCPNKIKDFNCKVIISSTKYGLEMKEQLEDIGVAEDRIYFCYSHETGNELEIKVRPSKEQLIQYDLLHRKEYSTNRRKVLVLCIAYSVYTKQLIENISKRYDNVEFSLLTRAEENTKKINSQYLRHIYCYKTKIDLKEILEQLPVYDAMQLLWIEQEWAYFYQLIREKTKLLNLNVGGSDFYRADREKREYKRKLIMCADRITAETEKTVQEFRAYYRKETIDKMGLLPFGIEVLDWINASRTCDRNKLKEKFHIPLNKIVITCGHNAIEEHQHIKMISVLKQLPKNIKELIVCVFPMTYPQNKKDYINSVQAELEGSGLEHVVLTEFMNFQSMAEYALISDIMIHVQTTDQLSSTMLEEMYAGSIVIAGSWLPYQSLHDMEIYFLDVDTIPEVTMVLEDVVANIENYKEKCRGNSEIVWNHSSWDELAPKWRALWD